MGPGSRDAPKTLPLSTTLPGWRFLSFGCRLRVFAAKRQGLADQSRVLADRGFDRARDILVGFEVNFGLLTALADARAVIGKPGAQSGEVCSGSP